MILKDFVTLASSSLLEDCVKYDHFEFVRTSNFSMREFFPRPYNLGFFPRDIPFHILNNVCHLMSFCQRLRDYCTSSAGVDCPLVINSGFRPKNINDSVGGAKHSNHLRGLAVDIRYPKQLSPSSFRDCVMKLLSDIPQYTYEFIDYPKKHFLHIAISDEKYYREHSENS